MKEIIASIILLITAFFLLRRFFKWICPIHVEASAKVFFDNSNPDKICAKIINRSSENQYISECNARGTYSLGYILKRHLRNPLIRPELYPNIWYGGVVYNLMKGEAIKLEPHQPLELSCKLIDHPLNAMFTPYFFVEVKLTSGRMIRSKKLMAPGRWKQIGRRLYRPA